MTKAKKSNNKLPKMNTMNKKLKKAGRKAVRQGVRPNLSNPSNPTFGPVSTITTAPVAIGNSMRGSNAKVVSRTLDTVRIIGRDFAFPAQATGAVTGWVNVGGFPLTPAAFVSSILRSYCQMYNKFKFHGVAVHYITSSSTSSTGDILFQVNKNRTDPCANNTATTFLSYALSDDKSILGPQWTNHTCMIKPVGGFKNLDYGQNTDFDYQSQGEVFLYSKTSTTDSPGYVIIDYDISFSELSINPKAGLLPNNTIMYQPVQLVGQAAAYTAGTTSLNFNIGTRWVGNNVITNITSSSNFAQGDVYKVTLDLTNTNAATWTTTAGTTPTAATLMDSLVQGANVAAPLSDGWTGYLIFYTTTSCQLLASIPAVIASYAVTNTAARAGFTGTVPAYGEAAGVPNAGVWLYGLCSFVGNFTGPKQQQQ